jgi:hypothetical protein
LHARGHGLADEGEGLVAVEAAQFDDASVEREAFGSEARFAESDAACVFVKNLAVVKQTRVYLVEPGLAEVPQLDAGEVVEAQNLRGRCRFSGVRGEGRGLLGDDLVTVAQLGLEGDGGVACGALEEALDLEGW